MLAVIDAIDSDGGNFRDSILGLQNELLGMDQVDCPVTHHFAPSVYAREIFMPAGAVVVGKIHKHAHLNIISKGRVIVSTEFGKKQLVAPCTFVSEAGTKRAVYIVEDCIWTTIHPTEETDLEKIEEHVIAKDYDALLEFQREKLEDMKGDTL
jgi:quercetin dioxygenase-like cupin family protein